MGRRLQGKRLVQVDIGKYIQSVTVYWKFAGVLFMIRGKVEGGRIVGRQVYLCWLYFYERGFFYIRKVYIIWYSFLGEFILRVLRIKKKG